ncbi:hypothetical protein ABSA28_00451 [Candidatus Hepatincolaceae symbiont of Richtersius coronifer]
MSSNKQNDASDQAWPSFVDILSSTLVVMCFALLITTMVLSITKVTSSSSKTNNTNESSPSSIKIESDILGEYRAEFQKLAIIANPSLRKEMEIQSSQPISDQAMQPVYIPRDATPVEDPQEIKEPGESTKQVLGDIPKTIDSRSVEVIKELIMVQKDVIEQQRKVIEQKNQEVFQTIREYQSLLALVTKDKEVEDIRQISNPKPDQALFAEINEDGDRLTGPSSVPKGNSNYALSPSNDPTKTLEILSSGVGVVFNFNDNAPFITKETYDSVRASLQQRVEDFRTKGVTIESKLSDFALSGAEAQRIAVERLLIFRSILIETGVPPSLIRLKTVEDNGQIQAETGGDNIQEENYGWINVKRND